MSASTVIVDLRYARSPAMTPEDERLALAFGIIGMWVKADCETRDGAVIAPHAPCNLEFSAAMIDGKSVRIAAK